jgi:effector-binding domain-containing protein
MRVMLRIARAAMPQRQKTVMSWIRLATLIAFAAILWTGPAPAQIPPPAAEMPVEPAAPQPLRPGDAFGQEVTLPERTIIYIKGHSDWNSAFVTLVDAFKSLKEYLDKQGVKPTGSAMSIYTQTDDTGFNFEAALPVAEAPKNPPKGDIAVGKTPSGRALKFVHRGSYDAMDATYEAITNYLDDKRLEAKDVFVEEYVTDPLTTAADKLEINVFVPVK